MSALDDLYQLRRESEENVRQFFADMDLTALTRATAPAALQQITPRLEIKCTIGAATGHRFPCPDGFARYDRWRFALAIQCITRPANDSVNALHDQYIGRIRSLCATLAQTTWTDFAHFPNVRMAEPLKDSGDSNSLKTAEGIEYSVVNFTGILCIREDAWPVPLVPPPAPPISEGREIDDTEGNPLVDTSGNELTGN